MACYRSRHKPIIPFIEGDGTGPDIWRASVRVFDPAVEKAYGGDRKIEWKEVLAGEKKPSSKQVNGCQRLALDALKEYIGINQVPCLLPLAAVSAP